MESISHCPLKEIVTEAAADLAPHAETFDAILCAGDMHGATIAAGVAMALDKPLLIACTSGHSCVVQHSVMFGTLPPDPRFCYVDDFFLLGGSLRHSASAIEHLCGARIVRAYEANFRRSRVLSPDFFVLDTAVTAPSSVTPPF